VKEVVRPPVPGTWMMLQRQQPLTKIKFIEPMYARLVNELPEGKDWLDEVKLDGYRCLAGRDSTGVMLWSRRETCSHAIPTIAVRQIHGASLADERGGAAGPLIVARRLTFLTSSMLRFIHRNFWR
jgi:hypothetical protein